MQSTPSPVQEQHKELPYKWIVALVVVFGSFMSILDQTVVNNALPALQKAFNTDLSGVQWTITAYTLTQGVIIPTTAFFADRLGSKRFYIIALALFTAGSALCGLAWNLPTMIIFRIIQGIGGAVLFPLSISLLFREFPVHQHGLASGIISLSALIAPAIGPMLGGYFITYASWPLIFFINVPVGIIGILMAMFLLREIRTADRKSFDPGGFVLVASGLALILYALAEVSRQGWDSGSVLAIMGSGLLLLTFFFLLEFRLIARGSQPLLDLRIFANRLFSISNAANALVAFTFFGSLILVPIYFQTLRGMNAFESGLMVLPLAGGSLLTSLIGARLVDRRGIQIILIPGTILMALSTWLFAQVTLDTPYEWLVVIAFIRGLGLGCLIQPLTVAAVAEIPKHQYTLASSLGTVVRSVFTSLGIAVLATLVQTRATMHMEELVHSGTALIQARQLGLNLAVQDAFWFTLIVFAGVFVLSFFIRIRKAGKVEPIVTK